MTSTSVDLWHKQYTSTLPTSNNSIISLTLNTIETALRLNLGENASTSLIDNILLSPFGSPAYTCTSKSTLSDIAPSDILSKINRYKSFESVYLPLNNIQKLDEVVTTLNKYVSQSKEAVTCILRDKSKLNIILLYKNYKSNEYILYEPKARLQSKLNSPHFLLFKNDKLLSVYLKNIFCVSDTSNECIAEFIRYKSNNSVGKDIDYYLLCKDLQIIGVELKLKNDNTAKTESKKETDENWLFNKLKHVQFKDIDTDENLVLDRAEFHAFFAFYGMDDKFVAICDGIFDAIDANNDGTVSLIEWFTWQNKFRKKDLHKLFVAKLGSYQLRDASNTPNDNNAKIKRKKKMSKIKMKNNQITAAVQHVYDEYVKQYGYSPKLPTHLMHFSKKSGSKINFMDCKNVIMANKEKIEIDEKKDDKTVIIQVKQENKTYKINRRPMDDDSGFFERPQLDKIYDDKKEENKPLKINKRPMDDDSGFIERPIYTENVNVSDRNKWFQTEHLTTQCKNKKELQKNEKENDFKICFSVHRIANIITTAKQNIQYAFDTFFCGESKDNNDGVYSITILLNDYHHLMEQHDTELEDITSFLSSEYSLECYGTNCEYLSRNYRNRSKINKENESKLYKSCDKKLIMISKQLDKIHSYILHSFDLNYRLSKTEKLNIFPTSNENNDEEKDDKKEDIEQDNDTKTIETIEKMQKIIQKKQIKMRKLVGDDRMLNTKFVTNVVDTQHEEKKMDEPNKKSPSKVSTIEYSFGFPFRYYKRFKDGKWFIINKYNNIKQELLNNPLQSISLNDYNNQLDSANVFLECSHIKCLRCSHIPLYSEPQQRDTGIAEKSAITIPHILSLLFYCNFSKLCTIFSSTFRRIKKDETDEEVKNRNSYYFNFSKLLLEAIHLYGTALSKKAFGKCVFHGVSRIMVFENMNQTLNGPFSTTSQMQVALQFASNRGLVLTLNRSQRIKYNKYFDCACISDYSGEAEKLFLGGRLQIIDILHVPTKQVFGWYCKAFTVLTSMLDANPVNMKIVKKKHAKFYLSMMDENSINKFPEYIQNVWTYTIQQIKSIEIDLQLMAVDKVDTDSDDGMGFWTRFMGRRKEVHEPDKYGYKSLNSFLMLENGWINLKRLCDLLPNLEYIAIGRYKRSDYGGKSMQILDGYKLNDALINNLLQYNPTTELSITLDKPDESEMSVSTFIAKCRETEKGKIKKQFVVLTGTIGSGMVGSGQPIVWICFNDTPLHQACANGEDELVLQLLNSNDEQVKSSINTQSKYSKATPLFIACDQGHIKCVQHLLRLESVDINSVDCNKGNVLMISVRLLHNDIAMMLLEHSDKMKEKGIKHGVLDINQCDNSGESVLHRAAAFNNHEIMETLIKHNANPNISNSSGRTALLIACEKQYTEIIEILLKSGTTDVDISNIVGLTPLMVCISERYTVGVELLIKYGADVNKINPHSEKNSQSATALYYAIKKKNKNFVPLLLEAGADPTLIGSDGQTLLHIAAEETQLEIMKLIYENASNKLTPETLSKWVNQQDKDGNTALYITTSDDDRESCAVFLIQTAKCDVNIINNQNESALRCAVDNDSNKIVKLLINSAADVGIIDKKGQSLLFRACDWGNKDLVKAIHTQYLEKHGEKNAKEFVNHTDEKGLTALFIACQQRKTDCTEYLISAGAEIILFDNDGRSVLHHAAKYFGQSKMMKVIYDELEWSWTMNKKSITEFINHRDNNHETALFAAAIDLKSSKYLISIGGEIDSQCNIDATDKYDDTALSRAASEGCLELINILLDCNAKIDTYNWQNETVFHQAASNGHVEILKILYNAYLQKTDLDTATKFVNHRNDDKETALFTAARVSNGSECVEFLLSVGSDINIFNNEGESLLYKASAFGEPKSLKLIYNYYLKTTNIETATKLVNAMNKEKQTALHAAAEHNYTESIEFLLSVGAVVIKSKDKEGNSILHKAVESTWSKSIGIKAIYEHYLQHTNDDEKEKKKFIENRNDNGETPLLTAAQHRRSEEVIKYLHSVGVEFNVRDGIKGRSPLHWTLEQGKNYVEPTQMICELYVKNLNEAEAKKFVNAQDFSKATALHLGCESERTDKIKYLLENTNCNVNIKDKNNETPIMIAARKGYTDIVKLLLNIGADLIDSNGNCEALRLARRKKKECSQVIEEYLMDKLSYDKANEIIEKYPEEYNDDDDDCLIM